MTHKLILTFLFALLLWTGNAFGSGNQDHTLENSAARPTVLIEEARVNKSIRRFLKKHPELPALRASCSSFEDCMAFEYNGKQYTQEDYEIHIKEYPLQVSKADLLFTFLNASPGDLWAGDCQFQLSYNHHSGTVFYQDEERGKLEEGELILVEIRIKLANVVPLRRATAFEILSIDRETGDVSFSYTSGMASKGIQCISVRENGEHCIVTHTSKYLSGNEYRDKNLYVTHHEKLLDSFYERLEAMVQLESRQEENSPKLNLSFVEAR